MANTARAVDDNCEDITEANKDTEDKDKTEDDFADLEPISNDQPTNSRKRKSISLCRHKLLGQTGYRS